MRKSLLFTLLFTHVFLFSQTNKVDSLLSIINSNKHDTLKILAKAELGEELGILRVGYWDTIANEAKKFKLKTTEAHSINNIGLISRMNNDNEKAMSYYYKSIKLFDELDDLIGVGNTYNNLGFLYENQGNISKALDCYFESLKHREKADDKRGIAESYNNIGFLYRDQGDTAKALDFLTKALNKYIEVGNKKGIAISYNNIGLIFKSQKKYDKALTYYNQSLAINKEIGSEKGTAFVYNNIAILYKEKKEYDISFDYLIKSKIIREKINDKENLSLIYDNIANHYLLKGNIGESYNYAIKAFTLAKEVHFPSKIQSASETLYKIYKIQKKHALALEMHELSVMMRDSINNQENKKSTYKQQLKYEYDKKEALAKLEQEKNQLAFSEESKRQKIITTSVIVGLILLLIFSVFIFNRFKISQKQKRIIELQKEKVEKQKEIIEEKQKEIIDSIHYAKRIQQSLLPNEKYIQKTVQRLNN